jgi:hypothetical protein
MNKYFELLDNSIVWKVTKDQVHSDNIEMSGLGVHGSVFRFAWGLILGWKAH